MYALIFTRVPSALGQYSRYFGIQASLLTSMPVTICILFYSINTRSSSVVTLARPPTHSSLKINSRSFLYASPHLWSELPHLLRQPRLDLPIPDSSLLHDHLTSRVSSSPLLSSVIPLIFFSNLKTFSFL